MYHSATYLEPAGIAGEHLPLSTVKSYARASCICLHPCSPLSHAHPPSTNMRAHVRRLPDSEHYCRCRPPPERFARSSHTPRKGYAPHAQRDRGKPRSAQPVSIPKRAHNPSADDTLRGTTRATPRFERRAKRAGAARPAAVPASWRGLPPPLRPARPLSTGAAAPAKAERRGR